MRPLKRPQRTLDGGWEPAEGLPPKEKPIAQRCDRCGGRFTERTPLDLAMWLVFKSLCPACLLVVESKLGKWR